MTMTDEQTESGFRSAYATIVATSPMPLEWDEIANQPVPLERPPKTTRLRNPLVAFSAAAVLVFVAVAAVMLAGTTDTVRDAGKSNEWRAILFLSNDATPAEIDVIADELQGLKGVTDWVYMNSEMARNEALVLFAEDERQTAIILEHPSIIPASLRFATTDEASARTVVRMAAALVNQGETAIVEGIVDRRGPLVATEPDDSTEPGPSQGDFIVTTTIPPN